MTNKQYFDGDIQDILEIREISSIPILRKEFIISEYQIIEAKSIGSDAILLIASILSKEEIKNYSLLAKDIGLEVLFEIHDAEELSATVCQLLSDSSHREKMVKAARRVVDKNRGSIQKLLSLIVPLLKS